MIDNFIFERTSQHPPTKISDGSRRGASLAASDDAFPQLSRSGIHSKASINPVNIINEDKTILARRHTPQVVAEHERAWTFLLEATVDAPFEETQRKRWSRRGLS